MILGVARVRLLAGWCFRVGVEAFVITDTVVGARIVMLLFDLVKLSDKTHLRVQALHVSPAQLLLSLRLAQGRSRQLTWAIALRSQAARRIEPATADPHAFSRRQ